MTVYKSKKPNMVEHNTVSIDTACDTQRKSYINRRGCGDMAMVMTQHSATAIVPRRVLGRRRSTIVRATAVSGTRGGGRRMRGGTVAIVGLGGRSW